MTKEIFPVPEAPESIDGILVKLGGTLVYNKDGENLCSLVVKNLPEDTTVKDVVDLLGINDKRIGLILINGEWGELSDALPQLGSKIFLSSPIGDG
jgi:hypothetical protein